MDMSKFQENFCEHLKKRDIPVSKLASRLKSNKSTLWNWSIGVRPQSIDTLKKIADFFEVEFYEFLFGMPDPHSKKENEDNAPIKIELTIRRQ